jgi:hypothetical protein
MATWQGTGDTVWDIWVTFCIVLHIDPYLQTVNDAIPLLQVFAHHYRSGTLAPRGAQVHSRMLEGALCSVGQALATLGSPDPRLQPSGKLDI